MQCGKVVYGVKTLKGLPNCVPNCFNHFEIWWIFKTYVSHFFLWKWQKLEKKIKKLAKLIVWYPSNPYLIRSKIYTKTLPRYSGCRISFGFGPVLAGSWAFMSFMTPPKTGFLQQAMYLGPYIKIISKNPTPTTSTATQLGLQLFCKEITIVFDRITFLK